VAQVSLLEGADIDQNGEITYEDFRRFVQRRETTIWEVFQSLDADGNGLLTHRDVMVALGELRCHPAATPDDDDSLSEDLEEAVAVMMARVAGPHRAGARPPSIFLDKNRTSD
jgi:hypothetical protein